MPELRLRYSGAQPYCASKIKEESLLIDEKKNLKQGERCSAHVNDG